MTSPILSGSTIKTADIGSVSVHDFDITTQAGIVNTAFEAGTPDLTVEFVAPLSGRVLVVVGGGLRSPNTEDSVQVAPEIREDDENGAVVENPAAGINAWTSTGFITNNYQYGSMAAVIPMNADGPTTPLEPGRTYFARVVQRVDGGDGDIFNREITIVPLPLGQVYSAIPLGLDTPPIRSGQDFRTQFNTGGSVASPNFGDPEFGLFFRGPASGRALIVVGGGIRDNTNNQRLRMCPEVRLDDINGELLLDPGSHAGTTAFSTHGWSNAGVTTSAYQYGSRIGFLGAPATDPLIPGQQYFARVAMDGGSTTDCFNRDLFVIGVP